MTGDGFAADGEGPVRSVRVNPFYMDACAVTNQQFERFARETGYKTEAERFGWSFVFHMFLRPKTRRTAQQAVAGCAVVVGHKRGLLAQAGGGPALI